MVGVISQMAFLTQGAKILRAAMLRRVVEVGDGQHDSAVGDWVGLVIHCAAEFATVPGPFQHRGADRFPIFGIAVFVFRFNRHNVVSVAVLGIG